MQLQSRYIFGMITTLFLSGMLLCCTLACSTSCHKDIVARLTRGGEWELIFRAKAGNGQKVTSAWFGVGYDHCSSGGCCLPRDGCFTDVIDTMALALEYRGPTRHLRSRIIDHWSPANIKKVKLALYERGMEVAYVIFNGKGSDNTNWFSSSRMMENSWCDMKSTGPFNIFSISGFHNERTFHINKAYGGCPNDYGWLSVSEGKVWCTWDRHSTYPQFLYARKGRVTHWESLVFGKAEVLAIFIQRD